MECRSALRPTPDKVELTKFALESAKHVLHYYNNYFGIKYPMPKLDMVAVPDFEAGAMENFGCITYRETDLLTDTKTGTFPRRSASRTWSRTRWRTSGLAIWSRCSGGTTSG